MGKTTKHLTQRESDAFLAKEGTRPFEFTARSVYEEALRAVSPPAPRRRLAQQMLLDGTVDVTKRARNRHGPARKSSFLPAHVKYARGDPARLLERALELRVEGVPPKCLDPKHARLYADVWALTGALGIAIGKRRQMVEARRG